MRRLMIVLFLALTPLVAKNKPVEQVEWKKLELEKPIDVNKKQYEAFLYALGARESSNNYENDKNFPYWGYYQIGPAVRKTLKVHVSWKEFKQDSLLQDYIMYQNLKFNYDKIGENYFNHFVGKKINGITITTSGLLAGAHIAGGGGVKRFLYSNGRYNPQDKFGTKVSDYMKEFADYEFDLNKIDVKYTKNT